jgi:hypothetical protein
VPYLFIKVQQIVPTSDGFLLAGLKVSEMSLEVFGVVALWWPVARSGLVNQTTKVSLVRFSAGFVAFALPITCELDGIQL